MDDNVYDLCEYRESGRIMTRESARQSRRMKQISEMMDAISRVNVALLGVIFAAELNRAADNDPLRIHVDEAIDATKRLTKFIKLRHDIVMSQELNQPF